MLKLKLKEILKREIKNHQLMVEYNLHNDGILYYMLENNEDVKKLIASFGIYVIENFTVCDSKIEIILYNVKYKDYTIVTIYKSEGDAE